MSVWLRGRWLLLALGVVIADQLSKWAIVRLVLRSGEIDVTSFFKLIVAYNAGAAFSFLSTASGWQRELFIGIALVASVWIVFLLFRHARERLFCCGLGLILGGAVGNVIDRLRLDHVVDFLYFYAGGYAFPAFNLADSAITCGAALLIWDGWRRPAAAGARPI